jgi:6-phosphogluconate dehydrogenase
MQLISEAYDLLRRAGGYTPAEIAAIFRTWNQGRLDSNLIEITAGSAEYGWDVDRGAMATIWRGGCIIRARFLDRIREAYADDPALPSLLVAPYFADAVRHGVDAWRRVVAKAALGGIPTPAFSSSLAYYDALRAERLPAALIQGLRDNFGAHTYRRVDRDGTFHVQWAGDKAEHPT